MPARSNRMQSNRKRRSIRPASRDRTGTRCAPSVRSLLYHASLAAFHKHHTRARYDSPRYPCLYRCCRPPTGRRRMSCIPVSLRCRLCVRTCPFLVFGIVFFSSACRAVAPPEIPMFPAGSGSPFPSLIIVISSQTRTGFPILTVSSSYPLALHRLLNAIWVFEMWCRFLQNLSYAAYTSFFSVFFPLTSSIHSLKNCMIGSALSCHLALTCSVVGSYVRCLFRMTILAYPIRRLSMPDFSSSV